MSMKKVKDTPCPRCDSTDTTIIKLRFWERMLRGDAVTDIKKCNKCGHEVSTHTRKVPW